MIYFKADNIVYLKSDEDIPEEQNDKVVSDDCEEQSKLLKSLYEYIKEEYFNEIDRKSRNDQKAFSLAALFVTILGIVLGAPILADIDIPSLPALIIVFYFITLGCFIAGLLCVSISFMMTTIDGRPDPGRVIEHFRNPSNENTEKALIQFLTVRTWNACKPYKDSNLKRIKRMNIAFVLLLIGMIGLITTVVMVINLTPKG